MVMTRDLHRRAVKCREAIHVSNFCVVEKNREAIGREPFHALLDLEPGEHLALDGQRQRTQIARPWPGGDDYRVECFTPRVGDHLNAVWSAVDCIDHDSAPDLATERDQAVDHRGHCRLWPQEAGLHVSDSDIASGGRLRRGAMAQL